MWSYLKWAKTPMRRRLGIRYVLDRRPDHRRAIFLAGTARSGTTWLSEVINFRNEHRYVFEPFNPKRVPLVEPFGSRRYLRPNDAHPELRAIAEEVLTGRLRDPWTERYNRRFVANRRLVKDVRANLFLKWLHGEFPGMPIVLLLRHPCAVAHSYAKHGWYGSVGDLLSQPALVEDYLRPHVEVIAGARDNFERALCIWCIETLVPLRQFAPGELHVVFYERLAEDPELEIERLFRFLGRPYDEGALAAVGRPSRTTRRDSAIANGADPARGWTRRVGESRVRWALEVVERFGLGGLYGNGPMPNPSALAALMATPGGSPARGAEP